MTNHPELPPCRCVAYTFPHRRGHLCWILQDEEEDRTGDNDDEDPEHLREELVQVAAVCLNWIECLDRKKT